VRAGKRMARGSPPPVERRLNVADRRARDAQARVTGLHRLLAATHIRLIRVRNWTRNATYRLSLNKIRFSRGDSKARKSQGVRLTFFRLPIIYRVLPVGSMLSTQGPLFGVTLATSGVEDEDVRLRRRL
jgi:hypothetical protein